jgi:hypothetical protein
VERKGNMSDNKNNFYEISKKEDLDKAIVIDPKNEYIHIEDHLKEMQKEFSNQDGIIDILKINPPCPTFGVVGTEEALEYFTEKFNAERRHLNNFEQACYMQTIILLERELMNEGKLEVKESN